MPRDRRLHPGSWGGSANALIRALGPSSRKLGLASFFFLGLGLVSGALPPSATGWSPQTAVTIALTCYSIGLILALLAFMQSRRGQSLDGVTKFLARAPLALVTIGVLIFFLRAMTGW